MNEVLHPRTMRQLPKRISLVISDVDGTLLDPQKQLSDRARHTVLALSDAGIRFAIISSRPPFGLRMLIEPLQLQMPLVGGNGAVCVLPDLTVLESRELAPQLAMTVVERILDAGLDVWIYTADHWLVRDGRAPHVAQETAALHCAPQIVPEWQADLLQHAIKIVGVSDDLGSVERCETLLQDQLGETANALRSQPYYLDVTHPLATKGRAVRSLAQRFDIPVDEILSIGDMANDVSMFAESGFAIAMGNAETNVQNRADAVTASNTSDGFAEAMERFVLTGQRGGNG